ncbi:hypothetical protein KSP39_PZI009388 [Platanthera zijinensis]|uniref:Uncharacterized protein n=1 Tax=Platanthera zijinensis TaxID=2320716 RepID=A0AAP0BLC5_9ASPA
MIIYIYKYDLIRIMHYVHRASTPSYFHSFLLYIEIPPKKGKNFMDVDINGYTGPRLQSSLNFQFMLPSLFILGFSKQVFLFVSISYLEERLNSPKTSWKLWDYLKTFSSVVAPKSKLISLCVKILRT